MKHYSPRSLERAANPALATEEELLERLRGGLDGSETGKRRLALSVGVTPGRLSHMLRGSAPVSDGVAAALGFRKVTRFERIET